MIRHLLALVHAWFCAACRGDYCCPVARRAGLSAANRRPWDRPQGTLHR